MSAFRALGLVVVLALPLAVAGCGGSDDDSPPPAAQRTSLTIARDVDRFYHGRVRSKVSECSGSRRVVLFEERRGRDRQLGANRSGVAPVGVNAVGNFPETAWGVVPAQSVELRRGARIYAKTPRVQRSDYMCGAARSKVLLHRITSD